MPAARQRSKSPGPAQAKGAVKHPTPKASSKELDAKTIGILMLVFAIGYSAGAASAGGLSSEHTRHAETIKMNTAELGDDIDLDGHHQDLLFHLLDTNSNG